MSILDRMKSDDERLAAIMQRVGSSFDPATMPPDMRIEHIELKRKKPRLSKILGDANPLKAEDAELLREYFRLTKGS